MKRLLQLSFVLIGLMLMGCPYESDVEISTYEEAVKTDKKLLDEWVSFNEEGGKQELSISKLEKAVLQIYHKEFGKGNKLISREGYRVYSCEVGQYDIFNIEKKDGKYLFCKYGWTGKNEIYIQYIDEIFMTNNLKEDTLTTQNLNRFITQNVNNEKMYGDRIEFYRKHSPEYEKVRIYMKKSGF